MNFLNLQHMKKKKSKNPRNKKIVLMGRKYTLKYVPYLGKYDGDCDHPDTINKSIRIKMGLNGQEELETLIHEFLHALDWSKDESWVEHSASDIAKILYKMGWRKK